MMWRYTLADEFKEANLCLVLEIYTRTSTALTKEMKFAVFYDS